MAVSCEHYRSLEYEISKGKEILKTLESFRNIKGLNKLIKNIKGEIEFLKKLEKNGKPMNGKTNIENLEAITQCLLSLENPIEVYAVFKSKQNNDVDVDSLVKNGYVWVNSTTYKNSEDYMWVNSTTNEDVHVDIVAENGHEWIKVITSDTKKTAIQEKILNYAEKYQRAACFNKHEFKKPKIRFIFFSNLNFLLRKNLEKYNIKIDEIANSMLCTTLAEKRNLAMKFDTLNLDVSTMITYVTNLTNGYINNQFRSDVLYAAKEEIKYPMKKILDEIFLEKNLICCKTAENTFNYIIKYHAGPKEKRRANEFLKRINVYEDSESIFSLSDHIKTISAVIFSTGENLKIPTVTANRTFIRAAAQQGIKLTAIVHHPRPLSEIHEK